MILVDANVLLDVVTRDRVWLGWSQGELARRAGGLAINPIIYAELAPAFRTEGELEVAFREWPLHRLELPYTAAWAASRAFAEYRARGGTRTAPLPDFYIGAHAEAEGHTLLTRDAARYRTYFPTVPLICPVLPR
jgi:predicted nucleic acid-binding protein